MVMGRSDRVSATVVIGLGGTGARVLRRVRSRLGNRPLVKFLVLDSDPSESQDFEDGEFLNIGVAGEIRDLIDGFPRLQRTVATEVRKWFPSRPYKGPWAASTVSLAEGAKQTRCLGRLALWHHSRSIRERLADIMDGLKAHPAHAAALRDGFDVNPREKRVFIVASLGGGQGSGSFLDLAYLAGSIDDSFQRVAILVLPSAFRREIQEEGVRANAYAAMMELDHYMTEGNDFKARFQDNIRVTSSRPPFRYVYLLSGTPSEGMEFNHVEVCQVAADGLFAHMCFSSSGNITGALVAGIDTALNKKDDGKPTAYASFGFSSVVFPTRDMGEYCAYRLARELTASLTVTPIVASEEADPATEAKGFMSSHIEFQLRNAKVGPASLGTKPEAEHRNLPSAMSNWEEARSNETQRLTEILRSRSSEMTEAVKQSMDVKVQELSNFSQWGPNFAVQFISELQALATTRWNQTNSELEDEKQGLRGVSNVAQASLATLLSNTVKAFNSLALPFLKRPAVRRTLSDWLNKIDNIASYETQICEAEVARDVLEELRSHLVQLKASMDQVVASLRDAEERFRQQELESLQNLTQRRSLDTMRRVILSEQQIDKVYGVFESTNYKSLLCESMRFWTPEQPADRELSQPIVDFCKDRVREKNVGSEKVVDFLEVDGSLDRYFDDMRKETPLLWDLQALDYIPTDQTITTVLVGPGQGSKIDELARLSNIQIVQELGPAEEMSLAKFAYGVPLHQLEECKILQEQYLIESENTELHADYSAEFDEVIPKDMRPSEDDDVNPEDEKTSE